MALLSSVTCLFAFRSQLLGGESNALVTLEKVPSYLERDLTVAKSWEKALDVGVQLCELSKHFHGWPDAVGRDFLRIDPSSQKLNYGRGIHRVIGCRESTPAWTVMWDGCELGEQSSLLDQVVQPGSPIRGVQDSPSIISRALAAGDHERNDQGDDAAERLNPGGRHGQDLLQVPHRRSPFPSRHQRDRIIVPRQGQLCRALELSAAE